MLLPTLDLIRASGRSPLSYDELRGYSLPTSALVGVFVPLDPYSIVLRRNPYHVALFAGTAVAALAIIGLFSRRRPAWFLRILGVATLLVALGTPLLVFPYVLLPGFDNLKPLGRTLFLFSFALAALAGFGVDHLRRGLSRSRVGRALAAIVVVAAIGTTIVQLRFYDSRVEHTQSATSRELYPPTPILERLAKAHDPRVLPLQWVLPGSAALIYRLRNALGYESLVPARTQDFWRVVTGVPVGSLSHEPVQSAFEPWPVLGDVRLDLLPKAAVDFVAARPDARARGTGLRIVYRGRDGLLLRVPGPLPRTYLVGRCEATEDSRSALARYQTPSFDPRTAVLLEQDYLRRQGISCDATSGGAIGESHVVHEDVDMLRIEVDARRPGFLIVDDSWDPGWRATVDGSNAAVLPANSVFRAVPIEKGRHAVVLSYRPWSYELGLRISAVAALFTLGVLVVLGIGRRRKRQRP